MTYWLILFIRREAVVRALRLGKSLAYRAQTVGSNGLR